MPAANGPEVQVFTQTLAGRLPNLIMRLMLEHPLCLHAVQVFDLLSIFAPFGILPGQQALPSSITVARGYIAIANDLASQRHLNLFQFTTLSSPTPETWLWVSLVASDSIIHLEELVPCQPPDLGRASELAARLTDSLHTSGPARLAELALCERLQRLNQVYNSLNEIQTALEVNREVLKTITHALAAGIRALDALDDKYDTLIGTYCVPPGSS